MKDSKPHGPIRPTTALAETWWDEMNGCIRRTDPRPHVSNDNPFSESAFKTLKYRPDFPDRFGCEQDARAHCRRFFEWYNHEHRHGALGLCTPHEVHHGLASDTRARRYALCEPRSFADGGDRSS